MAGTIMVKLEIDGMKELQDKLSSPFAAQPARNFLNNGAILIQNYARKNAPIDQNRLRGSIAFTVDDGNPIPLFAEIGTNVSYAPPVEFGRSAGSAQPPPGALLGWMSRHGIPAEAEFPLARKIARDGIKPVHFMTNAIEDAKPRIGGEFLVIFARELEEAAVKRGA